jgi:hypothetical protein
MTDLTKEDLKNICESLIYHRKCIVRDLHGLLKWGSTPEDMERTWKLGDEREKIEGLLVKIIGEKPSDNVWDFIEIDHEGIVNDGVFWRREPEVF